MAEKEITDAYIRRLQNLGPYKDKTPDEIRTMLEQKRTAGPKQTKADKDYEDRFQEKLNLLVDEFAVDFNNSNDVEALHNLVRLLIQNENLDRDIRAIQDNPNKTRDDIAILKNLGDLQRNNNMSLSDIQEKLGISRKQRKDKATDDIPQWIEGVLEKADTFFKRKTVTMECPKCEIELIRYWLNFPDLTTTVTFKAECPQCGEMVVYNR